MLPSPRTYTPALAKLYADQGYLRKAAEIYRHLVRQHANRTDLKEALADIERQIARRPSPARKEIELLLREWKEMLKRTRKKEPNGI